MPTNPVHSVVGSVVMDAPPPHVESGAGSVSDRLSDYIIMVAGATEQIAPWGTDPKTRDQQLRHFWPSEPILAGALSTTASKYAGFEWDLDGADRMVGVYERVLHSSQHGEGWMAMMMPFVLDYLSQDNGAFLEVVRTDNTPTAPVVQLNHLDSNRCRRTGNKNAPIIFYDRNNDGHIMQWYQVISLCEMPSPIEIHNGRQYCAVTRVLNAARLMRDVAQYKRERATGQDTKQIHVVSGVNPAKVESAVSDARNVSQAQGMQRYTRAVIVGSVSPDAKAGVATIDLAKLPDGYDEEKAQRDYLTVVALALGNDYQDYAPLPMGAQGSGAQSEILALKTRGKGPNFFMRSLEFIFNYHGILPQGLTFAFGKQDAAQDLDDAKLRTLRAEERAMRIKSGELDEDTARLLAVAAGDLTQEQADALKGHKAVVAAPAGGPFGRDALGPKTDMQEGGNPAMSIQTA